MLVTHTHTHKQEEEDSERDLWRVKITFPRILNRIRIVSHVLGVLVITRFRDGLRRAGEGGRTEFRTSFLIVAIAGRRSATSPSTPQAGA